MQKVRIGSSDIEGSGLFSMAELKPGDKILKIDDSNVVSEKELTQYQKDYEADWLPDRVVLMQSPERYINHSCEPNSLIETTENGRRYVVAKKPIKIDEEITYDYGKDFTDKYKCGCGAPSCRNPIDA